MGDLGLDQGVDKDQAYRAEEDSHPNLGLEVDEEACSHHDLEDILDASIDRRGHKVSKEDKLDSLARWRGL